MLDYHSCGKIRKNLKNLSTAGRGGGRVENRTLKTSDIQPTEEILYTSKVISMEEISLELNISAQQESKFSSKVRYEYTCWDNKVCELATMCLPWQHWTKVLVWFDDVDIPAFHSCVVVDLWQSLTEWHLRVFWCAAARMSELELDQRTNIKFLVVSWCWCECKFTGIVLSRKRQFTSGWSVFLREDKVSLTKRDQDGQQQAELKKTLQKFVCVKIVGWLSGA